MLTHCKGMMKTRRNHITKQSLSLAALKNSWKCSCFFNIHILSIRCVDQSTFVDAAASLCKQVNLIDNIARLFSAGKTTSSELMMVTLAKGKKLECHQKETLDSFSSEFTGQHEFCWNVSLVLWSISRVLDWFCFNNHVVMEVAEYTTQSKRQKF